MGDWPLAELGDKTPLEAAATPNMDELAAMSLMGTIRTVPPEMPPGSDVANMALFGFDPARYHTGRGPIEAAAQGLVLDPDDLVWRTNLVTIDDFAPSALMRDYSAGHISTDVAAQVITDLQEHLGNDTFTLHPGVQYRHTLVQKGGAVQPEADILVRPPHDITDQPMDEDFAAFASSQRLYDLVRAAFERMQSLDSGAANAIWPWGQGRPLILDDFKKSFGLAGAVVTAVDLVRGLGRAANMAVLEVEGVTGLLNTNYEGKVAATLDFLQHGDFVYLHVEAPDECGHSGIASDKVEAMQRFDARIVAPLRQALAGQDVVFVVTCDHYTPIVERTHTHDPVPFIAAIDGVAPNHTNTTFSEALANQADIHLDAGHEFLPWLLDRIHNR
ncbi:MAG: 2,3-bisphosphoglycerate-independent phosphoglycerate mutase [Desulfovibrio sp.]|nr:MAG: 2,3-bisphosphoglycerate-independent phosphoglycerate mutase [Desulfovibrio sp.]